MADARQKVKDLENQANAIVLKINSLQTQFYSEDDGFKREGIQREIQKSFYEQDKNKEDLAKAQDVLQDLEKEARKSGAPARLDHGKMTNYELTAGCRFLFTPGTQFFNSSFVIRHSSFFIWFR